MRRNRPPQYCYHKVTGQAVVRLDGRDHYLGLFGTPESHERYERFVAEWRRSHSVRQSTANRGVPAVASHSADPTVNEVLLAYMQFAAAYYVKNGRTTHELVEMKLALRPLSHPKSVTED